MLGHANLSQTSTYLHAAEMGLHESMRRFENSRGKNVAKDPHMEHRPVGHAESEESPKDQLH
jgi:hypothetical protein